MEFSEIGKELGGLTAEQVFELAKFGKDILSHVGIFGLSNGLLGLVKNAMNVDNFNLTENQSAIETLIYIASIANGLNEKCWGERKTPLGLTGVDTDNFFFGMKNSTKIEAA